jgi:ATP-dependent RNA helicase DeaD
MAFTFELLSDPLLRAVQDLGFTEPSEIQQRAIPILLGGETDFVGQAQTGTGKTAAFCLPLLEQIDPSKRCVQALILSPTRELAGQISKEMDRFAKYLKINTAIVYGGVGYREQIRDIERAHIVIATPGRAIDHIEKGKMDLSKTSILVIDEADEMLKMGFIDDVELIMDRISVNAQKWMFSATMPKPIIRLMEQKLDEPQIVQIKKKTLSNESVTQSFCRLQRRDFTKALKAIILSESDFYGIVFSETREETRQLHEKLTSMGERVVALHGDLSQREREIAMEQFKSRKANILVCTDVAARGLDVPDITHVINMGLPRQSDSYVHRIGRTGRAGQTGLAISFVGPKDVNNKRQIERLTRQEMQPYELPKSEIMKQRKVSTEIEKMERLKGAIKDRGDEFQIDESFGLFNEFLDDLTKEEMAKLLFSYQFNGDFRSIDEIMQNLQRMAEPKSRFERRHGRSGRSGDRDRVGRRGGRRSDGRRGEGRRGDRRDGNRDGNRDERRGDRREGGRDGRRSERRGDRRRSEGQGERGPGRQFKRRNGKSASHRKGQVRA